MIKNAGQSESCMVSTELQTLAEQLVGYRASLASDSKRAESTQHLEQVAAAKGAAADAKMALAKVHLDTAVQWARLLKGRLAAAREHDDVSAEGPGEYTRFLNAQIQAAAVEVQAVAKR